MTVAAVFFLAALAAAQQLWAPKGQSKYVPPHKPHTKLADLKAKHKGKTDWREVIVDDEHLRSEYVYSRPGTKTPRALHPDTRAWWVVMEGEVRFEIEGADPFVARTGSMVANGAAPVSLTFSATPAATTRLMVGSGRVTAINGWMQRIRYWPRALTNAELQQVTT